VNCRPISRYGQNPAEGSRLTVAVACLWLATGAFANAAPAFTNPGFEDNGPAYNTVLNTFKTPLSGWTLSGSGEAGVMYYTNDAFTTGSGYTSQIVGMRQGRRISQTVNGFTPGQNYVIVWQGNSRLSGTPEGWLRITAGGYIVWGDTGGKHSGSFVNYTSYVFQAASTNVTIQFENPSAADNTVLLDNLQILSTTNPVTPMVDIFPVAISGSPTYTSEDPGYGVPPYTPYSQLRMQFAGSYTMTLRELRRKWKYDVSFYACNRSGSLNDFRVMMDGVTLLGGTNYTVGYTWVKRSFECVSTGTTARLTFQTFCTGGGDRTVFFDAFRARSLGPQFQGTLFAIR